MSKKYAKLNSLIEKWQLEDDKSLTFPKKVPVNFTKEFQICESCSCSLPLSEFSKDKFYQYKKKCKKCENKTKHKYRAKITECDGKKFASKAEARFYASLKLLQKSGEVLFFLQQVPFHLPGNTKYLADFMVFYADGNCSVIDVKGRDLPMSIMKRKQVEDLYPVTIEIVHF
jgi:hypothetical protein